MAADGINSPSLELNPTIGHWLSFDRTGAIGIKSGKVELGQGILTALRQIVATEFGTTLDLIRIEESSTAQSPNEAFTAGSMSIEHSGNALRAAARAARTVIASPNFVASRLEEIDLNLDIISVLTGSASESAGSPKSSLPDLPTENRITSASRIDLPTKIVGQPAFLQDWRLPGQVFARMVHPPQRGSVLIEHHPEDALAISGVSHVFCQESFLAVVAIDEYSAIQGALALSQSSVWGEPESEVSQINNEEIFGLLRSSPGVKEVYAESDPEQVRTDGKLVQASYSREFIAHASIGTSCAIALKENEQLHVWSHTQGIYPLRSDLAKLLEISPDNVEVSHVPSAGCYGHNPADDAAAEAAVLATAFPGIPIALTWSREAELAWDPFGPAAIVDIAARVSETGELTSWDYQAFSTGHSTRPTTLAIPAFLASELLTPGVHLPPAGDPPFATGGGIGRNAVPGYRIGSITAQGHLSQNMPIRTSALRSLGAHLNVFATESHMDDLADLVGIDPIDLRTSNLDDLRGIDVLNRVRQLASWDSYSVSESTGLGVGYARYKNKGAWCAVVAEVEVEKSVVVRNLWIAADVGQVINLDGVLNQIEGGAIQSLSWTLKERVRIEGGKVTSDNWEDYPIIRFTEVPPIHIEILDQPDQQSLGSGEAAMGPTAAAVGNAIAQILGIRIRDLPIDPVNILKTIG